MLYPCVAVVYVYDESKGSHLGLVQAKSRADFYLVCLNNSLAGRENFAAAFCGRYWPY